MMPEARGHVDKVRLARNLREAHWSPRIRREADDGQPVLDIRDGF